MLHGEGGGWQGGSRLVRACEAARANLNLFVSLPPNSSSSFWIPFSLFKLQSKSSLGRARHMTISGSTEHAPEILRHAAYGACRLDRHMAYGRLTSSVGVELG